MHSGILINIGSGNGLFLFSQQAITEINADLLMIGPIGRNFSEILSKYKHLLSH